MSPRKKALLAFVSALILLVVSGLAATVAIVRFLHTASWAEHSYDVQIALGDIQSSLNDAARTRTTFLNSGDWSQLTPYDQLKGEVHQRLDYVRDLTKDNPVQRSLYARLEDNILRRMELLDTSVEMRKSGPLNDATQLRLSRENVSAAADFSDIMQKMMSEEQILLGQRKQLRHSLHRCTLHTPGHLRFCHPPFVDSFPLAHQRTGAARTR
jgi:CHASE3 domain sensor protein